MKIYINGNPFDAVIYDDDTSILQRYAETAPDTLPEYLRVSSDPVPISEGVRLEVTDVRDVLKATELRELAKGEEMKNLLTEYPGLNKRDVALLWLHQHYTDTDRLDVMLMEHESSLRKIDRQKFYNTREVTELFRGYPKIVAEKRKELSKTLRRQTEVMKELDTVDAPEPGDFELEEVTLLISLALQNGVSLPDAFDALNVSRSIPFVHLRYRGGDWYKIYKHIIPPEEWVNHDPSADGLYFKILSVPYSRLTSRGRMESLYSDGVWLENNNVEIEFSVDAEIGESSVKKKFFDAIGDRLEYRVLQERQLSVKGKFSVEDVLFNRAVFADMVTNSPTLNYFLFFNERIQDTKGPYRSAITKKRFGFYYEPNQHYVLNTALTVIVTPYVSEEDNRQWVDVRVMRASNFQQANAFRVVFSKLLGVYQDDYQATIDLYSDLLPATKADFEKYIRKPRGKKKKDEKSGKRLVALKSKRPGVFRPGYASECFQAYQPYLITSEAKAEEVKRRYGEHKVMEYIDPTTGKKDWYACEPREPGEKGTHIYPGLRANKDKDHPRYREEVPFLPCCFTEDQYTKPGAILYKTLRAEELEAKDILKEAKIGDVGHILASNKRVGRGRFGQIPYYLSFVVKSAGYEEVEKGKQTFLPLLRYGVMDSPDSFLHCLEKAVTPGYSSLDKDGRIQSIRTVREKMAQMNFAVARQELYDYSDAEIRELLLEEGNYLDPGLWVRLAEVYYDINIFIYQIDEAHPNGAVVIPRFSQAYLLRDISEAKRTVFIVKNEMASGDWPYQCELLVKFDQSAKRAKRFTYVFENDPLVEQAIRVLYDANSVSVVTPKSIFFYEPVHIS